MSVSTIKKSVGIGGAVVALAAVLAACGSSPEVTALDNVSDRESSIIVEESPVEVEESHVAGDTVAVDGWDLTITEVVLNADAAIAQANQFNDAPVHHYVLVTVKGTNTGTEIDDLFWVSFSILGSDGVVYDEGYAVTPSDDLDTPSEAGPGGTVTTQFVADVPTEVLGSGAYILLGDDDVRFAL